MCYHEVLKLMSFFGNDVEGIIAQLIIIALEYRKI